MSEFDSFPYDFTMHNNAFIYRDVPDVPRARRRSFYNFFLKHQDAVEEQSPNKRPIKPSETNLSLSASLDKTGLSTTAPGTPKTRERRASSFVKKRPPLERGFSAQSALKFNKNAVVGKFGVVFDVVLVSF